MYKAKTTDGRNVIVDPSMGIHNYSGNANFDPKNYVWAMIEGGSFQPMNKNKLVKEKRMTGQELLEEAKQ